MAKKPLEPTRFPRPSIEVSGPAGRIRIAEADLLRYEKRGYSKIAGTEYVRATDDAPAQPNPTPPSSEPKTNKKKPSDK